MLKIKSILLIIYIFSVYSFNLRETKQKINFDSYVLALQWPNGACGGNDSCEISKKAEKNILTIHGLWPSLKSGKQMPDCTKGEKITEGNSQVFNLMKKYWFSFKGSNRDFWQHEYNKHGYCIAQEKNWNNYENYFSFVIKLYLNSYRFLFQKAFGNQRRVLELDVNDMKNKIQKVMPGANFKLRCDKNKYITEIHFYLEKDLTPNTKMRLSNSSCNKAKIVLK